MTHNSLGYEEQMCAALGNQVGFSAFQDVGELNKELEPFLMATFDFKLWLQHSSGTSLLGSGFRWVPCSTPSPDAQQKLNSTSDIPWGQEQDGLLQIWPCLQVIKKRRLGLWKATL